MTDVILTVLWVVLVADAVLLVLIVLLQSGRGGGLSGMLGGGGGMESALGPKSGLPKITGGMASVFFLAAILIGILSRDDSAFKVKTGKTGTTATDGAKEPAPKPTTAREAEKPTTAHEGAKPTTAEAPPAPATADDARPGTAAEPTARPGTAAAASTANPPE